MLFGYTIGLCWLDVAAAGVLGVIIGFLIGKHIKNNKEIKELENLQNK